ncbi:MAG: MFS transporter [Cytophagaceae bacterium]
MSFPKYDPYQALRYPEYRLFISSRLFLTLGIQMQTVIVGWQVYKITNDPFSLGLIGLAEFLPAISVSLFAGHAADVVPRKQIIIPSLALLSLCSIALLSYSLNEDFLLQHGAVPIYIIIFLSGFARGFIGPALFSFMPQLIERKAYSNAITWNSSTWQMAAVAGPAIGGIAYGFLGVELSYLIDLIFILLSLFLMLMVKSKPLPESSESNSMLDRIKTGIRFVFNNQIILSAISLDLFAVLFGGAVALLPVFAKDILHAGPEALGLLRAAPAIGSVLMAVGMAYRPIKKKAGVKLLLSVTGFGISIILFALSKEVWLSFILLLFSGVFDSVSVIIRSTLVHTLTPENMKGRVSAVNNIFIGSSNELGSFESGLAAKLLGVVPSVIFGGCMTLLVVGITAKKARQLRELNLE